MRLQQHFRHGSYAEQMRVPTENVKKLGQITAEEASQWCALGTALVPYGGFLAAKLQPGETVLVSGATGNFGSAAVSVALAMGAACVVTPGRNEKSWPTSSAASARGLSRSNSPATRTTTAKQ